MNQLVKELSGMDNYSTVLYIRGQCEAEVQAKSDIVHQRLKENCLEDKLRITYLDDTNKAVLLGRLQENQNYQAQRYKAVIVYPREAISDMQLEQLTSVMKNRGVKILLCDDAINSIDVVS